MTQSNLRKNSQQEEKEDTDNIFLNNADSFNGKYILSQLNKQCLENGFVEYDGISSVESVTKPNSTNIDETYSIVEENRNDHTADRTSVDVFNLDEVLKAKPTGQEPTLKYQIYGTLTDLKIQKPEGLFEVVRENCEQFKNMILKCDCIIYDISTDPSQISKALFTLNIIEQEVDKYKSGCSMKAARPCFLFILISTAMTWALTPRESRDDPDPLPFYEIDFRRRRPHPNYKEHYDCEQEVYQSGKRFKGTLRTVIVCSGTTYGYEENLLGFLFKRSWLNEDYLPIFGSGSNYIPLIHVQDLATIVCKLVEYPFLKSQYVLAVEETPTQLKYIVKYISRFLGSGSIQYITPEEAFLYSDIDQATFDRLTANIMMQPNFINDPLEISWKSDMNLVENIEDIVEEFKTFNGLKPLKIFIHGPPCCGKTKLAEKLCEYYNLRYISVKKLIETMNVQHWISSSHSSKQWKSKVSFREKPYRRSSTSGVQDKIKEIEGVEELFDLEEFDSEDDFYQRKVLEEQRKLMPADYIEGARISDDSVNVLLRREILLNCSKNLGFVLEGYPKTMQQANDLFKKEGTRSSTHSENSVKDPRLLPNYVLSLDAPDTFIFDRISQAPENTIKATHYNEKDMVRRLISFRNNNNRPELSPVDYFRDCDTDVLEIDVSEFPDEEMSCLFYICERIFGPPRSFGLTEKEIQELATAREHQMRLKTEKEELEKKLKNEREEKELDEKMEIVLKKYLDKRITKERILGPVTEQYRMFIARNLLPTLSKAMLMLAEEKPEDPVDFLAEFLFQNNPHGKMYDPRYKRNGEKTLSVQKDMPNVARFSDEKRY